MGQPARDPYQFYTPFSYITAADSTEFACTYVLNTFIVFSQKKIHDLRDYVFYLHTELLREASVGC